MGVGSGVIGCAAIGVGVEVTACAGGSMAGDGGATTDFVRATGMVAGGASDSAGIHGSACVDVEFGAAAAAAGAGAMNDSPATLACGVGPERMSCTASSGCPSRTACRSTKPSNESPARRADDGSMALGQSLSATSHTVTDAPWGSGRSATKIGSHSTCGRRCARCTSSTRFTPTAAAAPAMNAAANTVKDFGRWRVAVGLVVAADMRT